MKSFRLFLKLALMNQVRFFQSLSFYRAKFFNPGVLTVSNEIVQTFEKNGWDVDQNSEWHLGISYVPHPVKTNSIYLFEKTYLQANNTNVIVSIHPYNEEFVIIDSAENRTSGPSITVEGVVKTLNDALTLAQGSCQYWDEYIDNLTKKVSKQV